MEENVRVFAISEIVPERNELVIDDNTIYEIDLDCLDCLERNKKS